MYFNKLKVSTGKGIQGIPVFGWGLIVQENHTVYTYMCERMFARACARTCACMWCARVCVDNIFVKSNITARVCQFATDYSEKFNTLSCAH